MTIEENILKNLAYKYFQGELEAKDEKTLYDFIQTTYGQQRLRQWEEEWISQAEQSDRDEAAWKKLESKMYIKEAISPSILHSKNAKFWLKTAAVVLLILNVTMGLWLVFHKQSPVTYQICEAPYGEKAKLTLPDGTTVMLNSGSKLTYSNQFMASNRIVELSGEGYFEVKKHNGKDFTINTKECNLVVKGTKFNISAYDDDTEVVTSLFEGKVVLMDNSNTIEMHPGELVAYKLNTHQFIKQKTKSLQAKAWIDGNIEFDDISLGELCKRLSRQYNVNIQVASKQLEDTHYSISLRNKESISEILNALKELIPIKVVYQEKKIVISSL